VYSVSSGAGYFPGRALVRRDGVAQAERTRPDAAALAEALAPRGPADGASGTRARPPRVPGATQPAQPAQPARAKEPGGSATAATGESPGWFHPSVTCVSAGFFGWDMATGQIMCEESTYRLHGLPGDGSATMEMFLDRVPDQDRATVQQVVDRMMGSCGTYQVEYRVLGADGSLRSMEARGHVVSGPDGRPAKMIGLVMDTTAIQAKRDAERRRLHEGAERASRTHTFMAALASAVTVDDIVAAARVGLGAYGANSMLLVAEHDGRRAVVASYGFGPEAVAAFGQPDRPPGSPVSDAIADGSAVYLCSAGELTLRYPYLAGVAARSAQRAWVAVPVPDSKGRLGACLMGFPRPREFPAEERALLFAASGLLAQSFDRARMYESEHALARELQRGLLPRGPLSVAGMTIAARYRPATSGMEIGGDFYDAIELPDGRVALVIGDVQGHNLIAASLMGRLRTVVQAYTSEGHGPAEVMSRANHWLADLNADLDMAMYATCCFVVVDPVSGELVMCRAGHPAPAMVTGDSAAAYLEYGDDLPLGVDAGTGYATTRRTVPAGTTLVLTTDGLLDADGTDHERNARCLLRVLGEGAAEEVETLADRLLDTAQPQTRHGDDIALLVARVNGDNGASGSRF
jgi:serine phosphatase RsbU (regulator of sigma subunit)/PAS domain-containing protein